MIFILNHILIFTHHMKNFVPPLFSSILLLIPTFSHAQWDFLYASGKINYEIDLSSKTVLDAPQQLISIQISSSFPLKNRTITTYLISCKKYQYQILHVKKPTDNKTSDQNFNTQNLVLNLKEFNPKNNILLSKIRTESCKIHAPNFKGQIKTVTAQ